MSILVSEAHVEEARLERLRSHGLASVMGGRR